MAEMATMSPDDIRIQMGSMENDAARATEDREEKTDAPEKKNVREVYVLYRIQRIGDLNTGEGTFRVHMYWRFWWLATPKEL